ncbi:hypothetical protein H480_19563, partial [Amycolatopsis vancoresmycina DSM 44592]
MAHVADVVTLAMPGWSVAAGEGAASVAEEEGPAQPSRDQPAEAAEVEGFALLTQERRDDHGIAGMHPGLSSSHRPGVAERGLP